MSERIANFIQVNRIYKLIDSREFERMALKSAMSVVPVSYTMNDRDVSVVLTREQTVMVVEIGIKDDIIRKKYPRKITPMELVEDVRTTIKQLINEGKL